MIEVRFGYLQEPTAIDWSAGTISPLDDIVSAVERVQTHESAYGNWLYPPLEQAPRDSNETKDAPLIPTTNFSLPATHLLSFKSQDWTDEGANFIIALFGMLKGRRLQREGWQHFYKMPLAPMQGCDFNADKREIASALEKAGEFWLTHTDPDIRKLAFGALHWHLFANSISMVSRDSMRNTWHWTHATNLQKKRKASKFTAMQNGHQGYAICSECLHLYGQMYLLESQSAPYQNGGML